jgi:hypothetical protein
MKRNFIFQKTALFMTCMLFMNACGTPSPAATTMPVPPTATAISFAPLPEGKIIFEKADGKKFAGTVYGQGETAIIFGNMAHDGEAQWDPFVKVADRDKFTLITYLRLGTDDASIEEETRLILQELRDHAYQRVICMGASLGVKSCASIAAEPEIIGMVMIAGVDHHFTSVDGKTLGEAYPKLFIAGGADPAASDTQQMYDGASEPKKLVLFSKDGMHGTRLFFSPAHSDEFLKLLLDFAEDLP